MRNYLGLAPEKDRGYAYVIIFCASIWSGFFLGYVVNFQLLTAQWKLSLGLFIEFFFIFYIILDLPFKTAALHGVFFVLSRYSSTIAVTVLLDKFSIRFWTTLSVTCLGLVSLLLIGYESHSMPHNILIIWYEIHTM